MLNDKVYVAHLRENSTEFQTLTEHLTGVADLAQKFAAEFFNGEWGRIAGELHDIGKYSDEFQNYIRQVTQESADKSVISKTDHTSAGAIYAEEVLAFLGRPLAYCIAGHHAGLLNWAHDIEISGDLQDRLSKKELLQRIHSFILSPIVQTSKLNPPCGKGIDSKYMHLWIRMLFSSLVDADYLDTEYFMKRELAEMRGRYDTLPQLIKKFEDFMKRKTENATNSRLNSIRNEILRQCKRMGEISPGFFSLNVPTGGGKTLSSMAWALVHAAKFNKKRIIYAIPYTSIITQTVQVFREMFGDENVVEHHSNILEDTSSLSADLATENWDAPIIVTTNVQLFESLYASKTSRCRKLHNIVKSVIILDEAQMLPPEFLDPIVTVLKGLVECFGTSVLISTATQPALTGKIGHGENIFNGIPDEELKEIIPDSLQLASELKRVRIEMPKNVEDVKQWDEIAEELKTFEQVLCIVNTRKDCRQLYKHMPKGTLHLSRLMCSAHIYDTIVKIKEKLSRNESVRVISTQLIEAGVDIDFPIVYRALAGLDSIAQSAGRCNREGKMNNGSLGLTKVFIAGNTRPPGLMGMGINAMIELLKLEGNGDFLSPEIFKKYFELFFNKVQDFDKAEINSLLIKDAQDMQFQFATAARNFRLINDKDTIDIIVSYNEGAELIELLKRKGPESWLMRKLQRYTVSVYQRDFIEINRTGCIEEFHGVNIQSDPCIYSPEAGLVYNDEVIEETMLI